MVRDFNVEGIDVYCEVYKCKFVNNIFTNIFLTFDHQKKKFQLYPCVSHVICIFFHLNLYLRIERMMNEGNDDRRNKVIIIKDMK